MNCFAIAAIQARSHAARLAVETLDPPVTAPVLDSMTITPDTMPHHHVARAVILDLQPSQMVAALVAVEDAIKVQYRHAVRTGWRAASDSLRVYFYAF